MAGKPRIRSNRAHITARAETQELQWASPQQEVCFNWGPTPICASGGFGSAKTYAFCLKALSLSSLFPNNRGMVGRRVWEELKKTTMSTFFKLCPPEAYIEGRRSDADKILKLNNGSEILWMHLDDEDISGIIRGVEINWFFLDQGEEIEEEIFETLLTRLGRWDQAVVPEQVVVDHGYSLETWPWRNPSTGQLLPPSYAMVACNPDTEVHWIYRRFHEDSRDWQEKYRHQGYRMVTMRSDENKFLPKRNLEEMLSKDESFVRRFVRGEWGIPEGQIHKIDKLSIIQGTDELLAWIRQACTLHRTLDHGDAAPTVCLWWGVDGAGNVFCYREYYQPDQLVSVHRAAITRLSRNEQYKLNIADPSIFYLTQQKHGGRWSVADEYWDCKEHPRETALFWTPGDNNELGTRNRINEYLKVDPKRIHPITKERGSPRLFFLEKNKDYPNGCHRVLVETRSQRREKLGMDSGRPIFCDERDDSVTDHAYDPLRYFIASRPPIATPAATQPAAGSFERIAQQYDEWRRRGGIQQNRRILKKRAARMMGVA